MKKIITPPEEQTYERFCRVFAGVYRKHYKNRVSGGFTCYIREAIGKWLCWDDEDRTYRLGRASGEDACGYRIAKALLAQGWDESYIEAYVDDQQDRVDKGDARPEGFTELAALAATGAGIRWHRDHGWARGVNYDRWRWLMAGGPDVEQYADEELEDEEEDD